jgi:hypothetical protein
VFGGGGRVKKSSRAPPMVKEEVLSMAARWCRSKHWIARAAVLAVVAAAFVVAGGLPAQAQAYSPYQYYGTQCQTYSYGGLTYNTCNPSNGYYNDPYSYGPGPYYHSPRAIDRGAPGEGEGSNGHE